MYIYKSRFQNIKLRSFYSETGLDRNYRRYYIIISRYSGERRHCPNPSFAIVGLKRSKCSLKLTGSELMWMVWSGMSTKYLKNTLKT
jgi:hypothetical protein